MNKPICPFCRKTHDWISINDGGSLSCPRCGPYHLCGPSRTPVKGSPGPSLCPKCQAKSTLSTCPFCSKPHEQHYLYDGGSNECPRCGPYHICANGIPVRGSPGPGICERCKMSKSIKQNFVAGCDGCGQGIPNGQSVRFKCLQCPDFDFCKTCVSTKQHDNLHSFYDPFVSKADLLVRE